MQTGFVLIANDSNYLGHGVYFFEDQTAHARSWARSKCSKIEAGWRIAVIESKIKYGRCLSLADSEQWTNLIWFTKEVERITGRADYSRAQLINLAAEQMGIDVIKAVRVKNSYKPGDQVVGPGFTTEAEVILCVRNLANILSKTLLIEEMGQPGRN